MLLKQSHEVEMEETIWTLEAKISLILKQIREIKLHTNLLKTNTLPVYSKKIWRSNSKLFY